MSDQGQGVRKLGVQQVPSGKKGKPYVLGCFLFAGHNKDKQEPHPNPACKGGGYFRNVFEKLATHKKMSPEARSSLNFRGQRYEKLFI